MKEKSLGFQSGTYIVHSDFSFYCKGSNFTQTDSNLAEIVLCMFFLCRLTISKLQNWTTETSWWAWWTQHLLLCATHRWKTTVFHVVSAHGFSLGDSRFNIWTVSDVTSLTETKGMRVASCLCRRGGGCVHRAGCMIDLSLSFPTMVSLQLFSR